MLNVCLFAFLALMLGGSYPLTELALRGFDPVTLVLIRLVVGAVFISAWMAARAQPLPRGQRRAVLLVAVGLLNTGGSFLLVTWGQKYVTASYTATLLASNPIFAAVGAAAVVPGERLSARRSLGVLIGFGGVVALFSNQLGWNAGGHGGPEALLGALAILGGAVALAVVAVTVKASLPSLLPAQLALPMLATGVVSVGAFEVAGLATGSLAAHASLSLWPVVATATLGVLNAGIGNVVYYTLIRAWGVTRTALVGFVVPFVGVALGAGFLHDRIGSNMVVGLVLITTSLLCVNPVTLRAQPGRA